MKKYGFAAGVLMSLYLLNRLVLLPHTAGLLHRVLTCWFADFLAGGMMLTVLFALLHRKGRKPLTVLPALAFLLTCGLFWEYVTPLYLSRSVSDPWDLLAVLLGGGCFLPILYRFQ